ncbi:hypothetical protein J5N97_030248 [Dioscorea zingiberensis]|uniref:Uncharacterized protein n=1 Tax=Dioscorea zingiberensis TaxID=325984 RepID=A0A9D5BXA5_9LILI|nr:hypothetical protein J5N97_030248 [Dioscorea zingiberensis]
MAEKGENPPLAIFGVMQTMLLLGQRPFKFPLSISVSRMSPNGSRLPFNHGACFRHVLNEFATKSREILDYVLKTMAKSLELNEDSFISLFGGRSVLDVRFNNYPSCSRPDLVNGIKPHSDSSALTIILPDKDVEGLQIMSNGIFKSLVYRVVTNMNKARISVAFFYTPDGEAEIGPIDGLVMDCGMTASFLDEVRNVAKEFFQIPMEEKQKYSNLKHGKFHYQGYGNDEVITDDQILDWTHRLYLTVQPDDMRKLELWPENPSSFRHVLNKFSTKSREMLDYVLKIMAKSLELNGDSFISLFGDRSVLDVRFNNYLSCSRPDLVNGIKPHSDSSQGYHYFADKEM